MQFVRPQPVKRQLPAHALQRLVWALTVPMAVLLPIWASIGRILLGAGGWLTFSMILLGAPVLFLLQAGTSALILLRARWVSPAAAGWFTTLFSLVTWFCLLVFPLGFGDVGDAPGSGVDSPLEGLGVSASLSSALATTTLVVGCIGLVVSLVAAMLELDRSR